MNAKEPQICTPFFSKPDSVPITSNNSKPVHVYLAGPDVFRPECVAYGEQLKKKVSEQGFIPHFPMDPEIKDFKHDRETALRIAKENMNLMRKSQIILANMTPFHGPSMDDGTASEMAFMARDPNALVVGYYLKPVEDFATRVVKEYYAGKVTRKDGNITGNDGYTVENFAGLKENLMLEAYVEFSGGQIYQTLEEAISQLPELWAQKQAKVETKALAFS